MQIFVKAKPKSKKPSVTQVDDTHFIVAVAEAAAHGRANEAIGKALARFLDIRRSDVILVRGEKSKEKVYNIPLSPAEMPKK